MPKKVLITGGAGFIGLHLSRSLSNQGYHVTILDNLDRGKADRDFKDLIKKKNVKFVKADITNPKTFHKLKGKFDYIYHLAALNGTDNFYKIPDRVIKVGVIGTLNILDWFVKHKKGKLLFSSSSEAYSGGLNLLKDRFPIPTPEGVPLIVENPENVRWSYGASKILGEVSIHAYAKTHKMKNFTIIRYHNIYGPRMGFEHVIPQFIERIVKKENPFNIFGGQEARTFCYIDDGVKATQMVMESEKTNGQTVNIGRSDDEIKIIDLAKKLFKIVGVHPQINIKDAPEGSVKRRCPKVEKLKRIGFTAEIPLLEGLRKTYEWYKDKF
jgi:nucleoside-diphosphate-sugar epimerase